MIGAKTAIKTLAAGIAGVTDGSLADIAAVLPNVRFSLKLPTPDIASLYVASELE
jgi:hypothetical protein